jgi:magnesium chelatase family protein
MLATAHSSTLVGLEAYPVHVEVDIARGLPAFDLVGLPEASVKESRVRVRSALDQLGFPFPSKRVTVNLAPADVRKYGAGFDLAIAVATLAASSEVPADVLAEWMLVGELSLTGAIRAVRGVLSQVLCAKRRGFKGVIVPAANAAEAAVVDGIDVRAAATLRDVVDFLTGRGELEAARAEGGPVMRDAPTDLSDVRGQGAAKRALEIAAAGGHNVLFVGPPGGGKTMLARTMPGLLPPMTFSEAIEATSIHSVAGLLRPGVSLLDERPFRAPHHTASTVGLVGGGDPPRPGEIALAHHGVLFLDELPEFPREALEGLREPLEEGAVTIVRARTRTTFPARFTLVAAMNPCPCGYHGDPLDRCSCSDERVKRYRARVSGPLLDRIDLYVALPPVRIAQLGEPADGPTSAEVRARVVAARERQRSRPNTEGEINARLAPRVLREVAALEGDARTLLSTACERLGLSARAAMRVLRVARTIADLEGEERIASAHIAEAIGYRTPGVG